MAGRGDSGGVRPDRWRAGPQALPVLHLTVSVAETEADAVAVTVTESGNSYGGLIKCGYYPFHAVFRIYVTVPVPAY